MKNPRTSYVVGSIIVALGLLEFFAAFYLKIKAGHECTVFGCVIYFDDIFDIGFGILGSIFLIIGSVVFGQSLKAGKNTIVYSTLIICLIFLAYLFNII